MTSSDRHRQIQHEFILAATTRQFLSAERWAAITANVSRWQAPPSQARRQALPPLASRVGTTPRPLSPHFFVISHEPDN